MYFSSFRLFLLLVLISVAIAVPLGIEYDKSEGLTPAQKANKERLDQATHDALLAHEQVKNMRETFDKHREGDSRATELYHAAFGKQADEDKVDAGIKKLETGNLRAKVATHTGFTGKYAGSIASVPWKQDKIGDPWIPGHAQFSSQFHGKGDNPLDDAGRAGTVIHEATHQLSATGDDVNLSGNIIKPDDEQSIADGDKTGYTSNHNMHKTVAEVKQDTKFTEVRDKAKNMHDNAESYALCSQPGALGRRDVHLWNRALRVGDYEQMNDLARRNSCKLPQKKGKQGTQPITKVSEKRPGGTASHHAVPNSRTVNASVAKKSSAVKKAEQHTVKGGSQTASKIPHPGTKPTTRKRKTVNAPAQKKSSQAALNKPGSPKGSPPSPKNGIQKGINANAHAAQGSRPAADKGASQAVSTKSRPGTKPANAPATKKGH
ncbi:hypothetical protein H0H92_013487 [Tricholoma furcatifolium]|nr:hypothetical protein H0H92_013487 [Tricholoma furcatifolium]